MSDSADSITLHFTYQYEDFHTRKNFSLRKEIFSSLAVGWLLVIGCVAYFFFAFAGVRTNPARPPEPVVNPSSMILVFCAVGYLFMRFSKSERKQWEKKYPPRPMTVTISHEGIVIQFPHATTSIMWSAFSSFQAGDLGFHLQSPHGHDFYLPYRPMTSEQLEQVHKLLEHQFGSALRPTRGFPVLPSQGKDGHAEA